MEKDNDNTDAWCSSFTENAGYYWIKLDHETMPLRYEYLLVKASWTGSAWRFFDCQNEQEIEYPRNAEWKYIRIPYL